VPLSLSRRRNLERIIIYRLSPNNPDSINRQHLPLEPNGMVSENCQSLGPNSSSMESMDGMSTSDQSRTSSELFRRSRLDLQSRLRTSSSDETKLDPAVYWPAFYSRDARFDGRFFIGVVTTKIYCRPICPVPFARKNNLVWLATAAVAEASGFRPCRRCRPQAAPGTPAWLGSSAVVSRALRLISEGALDDSNVDALAERLGIGSRQLRRLFVQHLGAPPLKIAITRRIHFAQNLIEETNLPITEIAMSAGFKSIRQFNHALRATAGQCPTDIRRLRGDLQDLPRKNGLVIRLSYRPPFCWSEALNFLRARSIPGVESVEEDSYQRIVEVEGEAGTITVWQDASDPQLFVRIDLPRYDFLMQVVERVGRIFDLGADPVQIASQLERDPTLKPLLNSLPGLRVPGAWDGFELSVSSMLGQELTTESHTPKQLLKRLVQAFGRPVKTSIPGLTHLFPRPQELVDADLSTAGIRGNRAEAVQALARAVLQKKLTFRALRTLDETVSRLRGATGINEATANYIAMRVFAEPDAFPCAARDLRRILGCGGSLVSPTESSRRTDNWRPWRAYAAMYLFASRLN
jgi:AraC family transcriptional regulator, regulatory protein of adaptative response / DNA-3-methyladenine glycosylase II